MPWWRLWVRVPLSAPFSKIFFLANKHGLKGSIVKKQAAARKLAKNTKKTQYTVHTGGESLQARNNLSYKKRKRYFENKKQWPKRKLPSKKADQLIEMGIIDERGFFLKGKKKNFYTRKKVDEKGLDFYGMPRGE